MDEKDVQEDGLKSEPNISISAYSYLFPYWKNYSYLFPYWKNNYYQLWTR